jgi:putative hemolysin
MTLILIEVGVLLVLVAANGLFSMAELAVLSARRVRLQKRAAAGDRGAGAALELAADPNRFLSTVQVGITLIGTIAGAYGGAALAQTLAESLEQVPALARSSRALAVAIVVLGITFVTLVFGELVPKRLALTRPEPIASLMARPMRALSVVAVPVVRVLGGSTELVVRLLGVKASTEPEVTEEEVKDLLLRGRQSGVFAPSEEKIVHRVFRLGDRRAGMLMTPRHEIVWLDAADPPAEMRRKIAGSPHSQFPVCDGDLDAVLGVVQVKDLLLRGLVGSGPCDLSGLIVLPLLLYEGMPAFEVLERFRTSGTSLAMVLDEFGSVEGLVTLTDIIEVLVGDLPDAGAGPDSRAVQRGDGSWLVDGRTPLDELTELIGLSIPTHGDYYTLAGFVIDRMRKIPSPADSFVWNGHTFEVVDMDGRRIDKVLVVPPHEPGDDSEAGPSSGADSDSDAGASSLNATT